MSAQESRSDFASVVRVADYLAPWLKLTIDEPLAQLHRKFWGTSMVDEAQEWRNGQLPIPALGGELGGEDQRMDVDVDDVDDNIISGCYVLNIDVEGLEFSKIWIRADYIRVYNFLETRNSSSRPVGRAPGAILTGEPGIGEFPLSLYQTSTNLHGAQREERLGVLCVTPTPCRKEASHLVSRPILLSVCRRRRLYKSRYQIILLPYLRLDSCGLR
jgi:hypothetical protein